MDVGVKYLGYFIALLLPAAFAQEVQDTVREFELSLSPQRCISLHKGQTCYQELSIHWRTPETGHYCLQINTQEAPLICWQGNEVTEQQFVFKGTDSLSFQIRSESDGRVVASRLFEVSWVYRSNRSTNSTWRLF